MVGSLLPNEITPHHVAHLQFSLCETCQPTTDNRVITLLKAPLGWLLYHEMVAMSPAANTPPLHENNVRQRYLPKTGIGRIFEVVSEDSSRIASICIRLSLLIELHRDGLGLAKWAHHSLQ